MEEIRNLEIPYFSFTITEIYLEMEDFEILFFQINLIIKY